MSLPRSPRLLLVSVLLALACWAVATAALSPSFEYGRDATAKPIVAFVALQTLAGALYLLALRYLRGVRITAGMMAALVALGLAQRLVMFVSTPILEDDFYRYLWDGGVVAHGLNPYEHSPSLLASATGSGSGAFDELAGQAGQVLDRVNHPTLRTIYPPLAQAAFALAHLAAPWDITGLRLVWLVLDAAVLAMLTGALWRDPSRRWQLALYWLNPLLIKEVYNSGHMELVLAAGTVAALVAASRQRAWSAGLALAYAVGAKVWPVLWLPLLVLRGARQGSRAKTVFLAAFLPAATLLAWPMLTAALGEGSGLEAYSRRWQMNDSAYMIVLAISRLFTADHAHLLARAVVAVALGSLALALARRPLVEPEDLFRRALVIVGALFLLSPTQFPWYFLWVLPVLALRPAWSLLALTVTLPIYYLRFHLSARGQAAVFDYGLVWLEFAPVWALIGWEWLRSGRKPLAEHADRAARPASPASRVAVVIPALNEERAIGRVIEAIPPWVSRVVVADNGSTDQTAAVAQRCGAAVVHEPRRGYGSACLAALAALDPCDIVVFLDGDLSDHPQEMSRLVEPIERDEADLVIGSRVLGLAQPGALTPQQRFGNALACRLIRLLYGVRFTDLGPFRAIRFESLRRLGMSDRDYGWTVQMQVRAARMGLRTVEAPVSYRRRIGTSKISGTVRGVVGAGTKIMGTIFREALRPRSPGSTGSMERLIIFARYPEPGRTKTRLIPLLGAVGAAVLHRRLVHATLATARRLRERRGVALEARVTGAPPDRIARQFGRDVQYRAQDDGDLGKRLGSAAAAALSQGARRVVMVGTDCPLLDASRVEQAFAALDRHDVVLGPAVDGGYYLIGLKKGHAGLFTGIAWGTGDVLAQTLGACDRLGLSRHLLPPLTDVDVPADLGGWASARLAPAHEQPRLSIIIPTLNEQDHLAATIASVLATAGMEVIVADGGSTDGTIPIARQFGVRVVESAPSRGGQLNAGAALARSDHLLFLHADTLLPDGYAAAVERTLADRRVSAGAFGLRIDAPGLAPRLIEWGVKVRSRWLGRPYGDQAMFMSRDTFERCGGFPGLPAMEDYAMLPRLARLGAVRVLKVSVLTSARRWQSRGWLNTTLKHQWMIARHHLNHPS